MSASPFAHVSHAPVLGRGGSGTAWDASAAVEDEDQSLMSYNTTGPGAVEQEDEDDDLMREIYEAMEAQCGLSGGPSPSWASPSTRRPTPSSRPSCVPHRSPIALGRSYLTCGALDAPAQRYGGSEMWSDAHNGVRPLAQVCDEGSLTHEAVLHLSQAERWSSQASHVSPASHRISPSDRHLLSPSRCQLHRARPHHRPHIPHHPCRRGARACHSLQYADAPRGVPRRRGRC